MVVAAVLLIIGVSVSCRVHQQEATTSTSSATPQPAEEWKLNPFKGLLSKSEDEDEDGDKLVRLAFDGAAGVKTPVADLLEGSCQDATADKQKWRLLVHTAFGDHYVRLSFKATSGGTEALASIDGRTMSFTGLAAAPRDIVTQGCQTLAKGDHDLKVSSPEFVTAVQRWLTYLAPDCDFRQTNGWFCDLPTVEASLAASELGSISTAMINRWSRQPYLITRRLAVAQSLARALNSNKREQRLNTLCNVMKFSLPAELPMALAHERWQKAVCREPGKYREQAALAGLTKSLNEIEFLRLLFERTSKLGMLTVRIPHTQTPSRELWISLQPAQEVADMLAAEGRAAAGNTPRTALPTCWHPIFGNSEATLQTARSLDLTGDTDGVSCGKAIVATSAELSADIRPERYLAESITSETEFVLTNGQSKLLRLPAGTYTYTVRPHSETLGDWEADPNVPPSTGTIVWTKQRPRALIKQW